MPTGIFKRTKEMYDSRRGKPSWNKGLKGWTKGTKAGFQKGNTYWKLNLTGKNIYCLECGEKFYAAQWELKRRAGRKVCSVECYRAYWQKNIKAKAVKGAGQANSGEGNFSWNGGSSFEPYSSEFNRKLKAKIKKRDNYTCQECDYPQEKLKYPLAVHHIDYNKKNSNEGNLITLCISCHTKTNFGREDWTNYFQAKI